MLSLWEWLTNKFSNANISTLLSQERNLNGRHDLNCKLTWNYKICLLQELRLLKTGERVSQKTEKGEFHFKMSIDFFYY